MTFGLTLMVAIPSFLWIVKSGAEKNLLGVAQATTFAFRQAIVTHHEREAQVQMNDAVRIKFPDSIILRDKNLNVLYNDGTIAPKPCLPTQSVCWINRFQQIEHLEPIYFDEDRSQIYAYADFRLTPVYDRAWLSLFLFLILAIFVTQIIGLSTALDRSSVTVATRLSQWAKYIRKPANPFLSITEQAPFEEFKETQDAIDDLQAEVSRLQQAAVDEAKAKLQLEILSEVGHDLRTPIGQVEKYFAILVASTKRTGVMSEEKIQSVERTIKRVKAVSDQVKELQKGLLCETQNCSISEQTTVLFNDMKLDSDVVSRKINLNFKSDSHKNISKISPVAFQRIFENLVRNAVDAVPEGGKVEVDIINQDGRPTLIVKDNGCGIPKGIRSEIFDFTFTTKGTRGTGLGLGIVKNLCALYGAEIAFNSLEQMGTMFKVSFLGTNESGVNV
jgi:signal transduction histidine kinase